LVRAKVRNNAQKPGSEFRLITVAMEVLVGANKRLLYHVLGIIPPGCHLVSESVNQSAVPTEKLFKGVVISLPGPDDQDLIAGLR